MLNSKNYSARFPSAVNTHSKYYFVQPVIPPVYDVQKSTCSSHRSNQIFLTNQGFEQCTCGSYQSYFSSDCMPINPPTPPENLISNQIVSTENLSEVSNDFSDVNADTNSKKSSVPESAHRYVPMRSVSCEDTDVDDYSKNSKRRVSFMVDELLLKIYNGERKFSSAGTTGTDSYFNGNSSDSSNHLGFKLNSLLKRKYSFSGISEDKCHKWYEVMRAKLMNKTLPELMALKDALECNIVFVGSVLVRQLKRRDILYSRRDAQYGVATAFLQAISAKRSEDTKIQFSMKPNAGESGFRQWHGAMKMVARLPGGIPREFRKTLWLTLAERHISSKNINWSQVERTCFNDSTNPDDEELGVQIVKDLHRTGCSLFCGTSGEENQAVLKRVLLAYARWNKSVGYCQGFNMLAALILEVMDRCEYNSLKVMIYLIEGVLPESYFANSLRGFSIDMAVFRDLLRLKLPELSKHLEALQTGSNDTGNTYEPPLTNAFTMQWFLTLFCNCLPHSTVLRVWDLIFLEGNQVLLKTALAIWDTLSDRIMPVKSADEFYSIMCVLTREMLEFGLMDANCLIKTISSIELSELTELRERYIYNITPWTQVARNGLRLFYSDDEDDSDEEGNDEKGSDGAYGFLKVATKHGSQSIRSISPSSILGPLANEKEKIALDILALKKQYCKIKERQRQAQIIFTATNNTPEIVGSMISSAPGPAINHLFLNKNAVSTPKVIKTQKPPPIPVSRAVQRLKENAVATDEPHSERGETVYWDKRMKKRKRRRTQISVSKTASLDSLPPEPDSSDSSDSSTTSSFKSSSSTELCDDIAEVDSEDANTSVSEYGSSPHYRLRSSNLSLLDDDKSESEQNQPKSDLPSEAGEHKSSESTSFSNLHHPNEEHILNVLLTSSIMANEQLNKEKALNEGSDRSSIQDTDLQSPNNEFKAFSDYCDNDAPKSQLSGSELSSRIDSRISPMDAEHGQSSPEDLETALEHMKIDALEILLSSQTLESIRRDSQTDFYHKTNCDRPSNDESTASFDGQTNLGPFSINRETEIALERILSENTEVLKKVNQTYSSFESRCGDSISRQNSQDTLFESLTNNNIPHLSGADCSQGPPESCLFEEVEECFKTDFQAPESSGASQYNRDILSSPRDENVFDNLLADSNDLELNFNVSGDDIGNISENIYSYMPTSPSDFVVAASEIVKNKNTPENELKCQLFSKNSRIKCQTDDENEEPKDNRKRKKYKSLDNLHVLPKSKLKIGLVSRAGKWISISIDNSDLVVFNHLPDNLIENVKLSSESTKGIDWRTSEIERKTDLNEWESSKKCSDAPKDPYLHLNFDIIAPGRKRRDPIEQYVHKKNIISQNYRAPELTAINFNPFPSKPNSRPPKELGVKLGLYSSGKK